MFSIIKTDFDEIKIIKPKGLNLILDFIGGEYVKKNINLLSSEVN